MNKQPLNTDLLSDALQAGFNEKGNFSFSTQESGQHVLFKEINAGNYLQIGVNPENYPKWDIGTLTLTDAQLRRHIRTKLVGWTVDKCPFEDIRISSDRTVQDIDELEAKTRSITFDVDDIMAIANMPNDKPLAIMLREVADRIDAGDTIDLELDYEELADLEMAETEKTYPESGILNHIYIQFLANQ
tara:strand:+ start:201 stop:764 length:564 start_codon:yes stop_codon:yes gene_type:complete